MYMSGRIFYYHGCSFCYFFIFPLNLFEDMHENGYTLHNGIRHVTLGGVVVTPEGQQAHTIVHVNGKGNEKSNTRGVRVQAFGVLSSASAFFPFDNSGPIVL